MKRTILDTALRELERAGIRPEQWVGGKHIRLRWSSPTGRPRYLTVSCSPGDYRAEKNNRARVRRILREDGLLDKRDAC